MSVAQAIPGRQHAANGIGGSPYGDGLSPAAAAGYPSSLGHSPQTSTSMRPRRLSANSSPTVSTLSSSATRASARRLSSTSNLSGPRARSKNRLSGSYDRESKFERLYGRSLGAGDEDALAEDDAETGGADDPGYSSSLGTKFKKLSTRGRSGSTSSTAATAGTSPASTVTTIYDGDRERPSTGKSSGRSKEKDLLRCEMCHKVYHHPQSLIKHRWQHTEQWNSASSLGLSKHQTVQALEAAVILSNPEALRLLPEDKSHWPAAVSPPTSGLLGSDRLNIDVLRNTGYSKSMPVHRSRLSGMLAAEQEDIEEEAQDDDASTDSESEFGMDGDAEAEEEDRSRAAREDTELAGMDQEMFSLDLQSASGSQAGTPAGRSIPLPDTSLPAPKLSGLAHSASRFNYGTSPANGAGFGGLQTIPSQVSMTAFAKSHSTPGSRPPYAGFSGSIRRPGVQNHVSQSGREGSLAPSNASGQTSSSASSHSERGDQSGDGPAGKYQHTPSKPPAPAQSQPPILSPGAHGGAIPNLSISAPVLGFFTEQNPPSASVVSPHLGPTKMTSPQLHATRSPHLAPIPAAIGIGQPLLGGREEEGHVSLEATAAEVLSISHKSQTRAFSPENERVLPPAHGRSTSRSFVPLASSPYARSPIATFERPPLSSVGQGRSFSSSAQQQPPAAPTNSVYGTSFGQAPIASSFRSTSYTQSPALGSIALPTAQAGRAKKSSSPDEAEEPIRRAEDDDDEIMDMDL